MTAGGVTLKKGDTLTIDGGSGQVMQGAVPMVKPELTGDFATLMGWADGVRRMKVRANAETPADARVARSDSAPRASAYAAPSICSSRASASSRCAK